ncbi:MAG: cell surface protein, partial [Acinetobacter sp.]
VDGSTGKIGGLSNKTWNAASITSGQAATEDQLKLVSDAQTATDSAAVKYDNAATKDKVTLGGGAAGTTITNVKAGGVNASSSDAINGSQLYAVSNNIKNAIGGSTTINAATGAITTTNIGGTGENTIDGAINSVSNTAKAAKTEVKEGDNIKVTSVVGVDGQSIYTVATAKDVSFDKVTVGSGATQITVDGSTGKIGGLSNKTWNAASITSGQAATEDQLKLVSDAQTATDSAAVKYDNAATKDKVTLGGGAAGTTITNVKAGGVNASSSDAINGSQLYAVSNNIKNAIGGSTTINAATGAITTTNIGGTGENTIDGAINSVSNTAKAAKTEVKEGDNIKVTSVVGVDGQSIYTVATAKDVSFDKVTVGSGATQITVDGSTGKIGGLSNKTWNAASITSGQAATEDQLKLVSDAQTATDSAAVKYDNAATKDKVTLGGGAAGTTITNVKAGGVNASSSDAINGSQLYAVSNNIKNAIGGSTTINAATGAITTTNIGGTGENTIDGAINSVSNTAKAAKTEVKEGDNIKVTSVVGVDGQSIYTVATAKDVSFDKVTVGSGATQITVDGSTGKIGGLSNKTWNAASITSGQAATEDQLKLVSDAQTATDNAAVKYDNAATKDKVTLGGGAAGTTITNVKAGAVNAGSSDAINGSQLYTVSNSIKNAIGGSTTINAATGAITTTNIGGTGENTIDGAINSVSNTAKAAKTEVKEGDNIKVTSVVGADGQSIYTVATAQDVSFDKVTVGGVVLNKANNDITGLSNKSLSAADFATQGRAATEEQLKTVSDAQSATDASAVKYDNAITKDKVTLGGATGTTISNVKAGALNASSTDAVNGSQLYATNQNVAQNTASISTLNTTVSNQGTQITTNTADISTLKGGFT